MPEITLFTKKDIPAFVEFRHQSKKESPFLNDSNIILATEQQKEYSADDKKAYLLKDKDKIGKTDMHICCESWFLLRPT